MRFVLDELGFQVSNISEVPSICKTGNRFTSPTWKFIPGFRLKVFALEQRS